MHSRTDKRISLKTKTFRVILTGSLILILLGSAIGLALYGYSSLRSYKDESRHLIDYTLLLEDQSYVERIFRETKKVYGSMPEDVRRDPQSEAFMEACVPLVDEDFFKARDILVKCREGTEQKNVSYMFTNPDQSAIVYVVDGDEEEWAFLPGQWVRADLSRIKGIEKTSWRLHITHEEEYGWVGTDFASMVDAKGKQIGYAVMDGLTATRKIRELDREDAKAIPIIALTANAFEEDVKSCLEAGMDAHMSKPVDIDQLMRLLGRLLAK